MRHIKFSELKRNPYRKRRAASRPRVKANNHTLGMVEALEARRQGLDEKIAEPIKAKA